MRALLTFFTVLPVGGSGSSVEDAARSAHLLPLAGLPGAALLLLLAHAMPPGVAATLALGAVLLTASLHHSDGVMDVGDALMVRGSPGRRREVLKDSRVGVGAAGALFVVYAPALAALIALAETAPIPAAVALLAGEVAARSAMLLLLVFGRPAEPRSSSAFFVRSLRKGRRRVAAIFFAVALPILASAPLPVLLGPTALLPTLLAPAASAAFALTLANRAFGGISGDVSGATGELARAVLLVALSATYY